MVIGKIEFMDDGEDGVGLGNLEGGRGSSRWEYIKRYIVVIKSIFFYDILVVILVGIFFF